MPSEVAGFKRLCHLKVVKLDGAMNEENKISLIEHMLELVSVEPLIVAKSHESRICRLADWQRSLRTQHWKDKSHYELVAEND